MRKRCTAILLTAVLVLSLLPVQVFAAGTVPAGWTPIYTLADLQDAINGYSAKKLILMNDIDADNEDYYSGGEAVADGIREDMVLDGNGHTIYNLKTTLLRYNQGTVRNLNTTIHDTPDDEEHLKYIFSTTYQVGVTNICGIAFSNSGTIENCRTRFTLRGETSLNRLMLNGITQTNYGTIRDCIVAMDVDYSINGGYFLFAGVAHNNTGNTGSDALIDHCLVLGTVTGSLYGRSSDTAGLAGMSYGARCVDSACALEKLSMTSNSELHFCPVFYPSESVDGAENCRVASDMKIEHVVTEKNINESGTVTAGEGYTLASRSSILADWDLSGIPGEAPDNIPSTKPTEPEETVEDPFPEGTAEFYYTASGSGEVKKYSFWYDSDFFNQGTVLQPELAVASLCLEMAAFTNGDNQNWDSTLSAQDTRQAYNIQRLYETLGFTNAQYVNYDKPLTSTSDKVAFSMAMKYIDNGKGGTDTLVAIPIRGSGYGGEWGSNFNLTLGWEYADYYNHIGFEAAARKAQDSVEQYLDSLDVRGDVKIWLVGFSRGAAVANILAHCLAEDPTPGGIKIQRKNLYAYTFATPAGVCGKQMDGSDSNIYNFISPVDVVPMAAPAQWDYDRYGVTVKLPDTMSDDVSRRFRQLSDAQGDVKINPSQRILLNDLLGWACDLVPDTANYYSSGLQELLTKGAGAKLGANPAKQAVEEDRTGLIEGLNLVMTGIKAVKHPVTTLVKQGVKYGLEQELGKIINHVSYAHYPELYLCQLEEAAERSANLMEEAETKQLLFPEKSVNVRFWEQSNSKAAAGSYLNGVCSSGDVIVEETAQGIVATFPAGKDYSFTVSGAGADQFGYIAYVYDNDTDGPVRTLEFTDLPLDSGETYTGEVPEYPYGDYYVEDSDGFLWDPDYDSEVDGERSPEYAVEVSFTDVSPNAYYYDAVQWAVEEGITSGTTATTFSPNAACTRAQAVTFLWRADGSPKPQSTRNPFTDVKAGSYYYDAVLWAVEQGITSGTSATTFSPNATCTRGQIVTFLYRSWGNPDIEVRTSFRDVPAGAYYADPVSWAADWGVTSGTSATTFSPNASCTRAQIVTFLYRSYCG